MPQGAQVSGFAGTVFRAGTNRACPLWVNLDRIELPGDVRCTPDNGRIADMARGPVRANSGKA